MGFTEADGVGETEALGVGVGVGVAVCANAVAPSSITPPKAPTAALVKIFLIIKNWLILTCYIHGETSLQYSTTM